MTKNINPKSPEKPAHMGLYRAMLSCKIGMDVLNEGKMINGASPIEYAVYNLLSAVEDIAKSMLEDKKARQIYPHEG
jgi:hypothetical protein